MAGGTQTPVTPVPVGPDQLQSGPSRILNSIAQTQTQTDTETRD